MPGKLTGDRLLDVLRTTRADVKVFRLRARRPVKVSVAEAVRLVKSGLFEGGGSTRRVRYIRELEPAPFVPCWRNTEAAVLWTEAA